MREIRKAEPFLALPKKRLRILPYFFENFNDYNLRLPLVKFIPCKPLILNTFRDRENIFYARNLFS